MKPEPMQHTNALPDHQSPFVKWFDLYGNVATAVACVAMIGGAIWYSYRTTTTARSESAWAAYSTARSAEEFANIADLYSSSEVGDWARIAEAERYLDTGIALMFTDRAAAVGDGKKGGELKKADEAFSKVLNSRSASSVLKERAQWGLAKSIETQCDGDTSKAIEAYSALVSKFPNSMYKSSAEARIESLKTGTDKEFYAWFHKQKPKPADLTKPKDGLPPGHPPVGKGDETEKSDAEKSDTEKTNDGEKKDGEPIDEKKSDEKKKDEPAAEKKDDAKPGDSKPEEQKPTESKPDEKKSDEAKSSTDKSSDPQSENKDAPAEKK